jgi:phosphoribosylformylglycinamidine synthase
MCVQGKHRTGGSALGQVYGQLGNSCPDVKMATVKAAFEVTQNLISQGALVSGHDISDGGIVVALLEMAFAGVAGIVIDLPDPGKEGPHAVLFAEEPGLVLEVAEASAKAVCMAYSEADVPCAIIGAATEAALCRVAVGGEVVIEGPTNSLRDMWERTSFQLERIQATEQTVVAEEMGLRHRVPPQWRMSFRPEWTDAALLSRKGKPRVAILREEGSNGDREMAAAVYAAGAS